MEGISFKSPAAKILINGKISLTGTPLCNKISIDNEIKIIVKNSNKYLGKVALNSNIAVKSIILEFSLI